ncbi:MAG: QcrA and Rieske domain-containing protein [Gemmatirosa sp.]
MSQLPILHASPAAASDTGGGAVSRRDFVASTAMSLLAAALASACGGSGDGGTTGPKPPAPQLPADAGATFVGNVLAVELARFGNLAQAGGFQVFGSVGAQRVDVIVINLGNDGYRAFTSICTHEQCPVGSFNGSRIVCPCHGSEYDTAGRNVVGPATRPLAEYRTAFDATTRVVTVTKG